MQTRMHAGQRGAAAPQPAYTALPIFCFCPADGCFQSQACLAELLALPDAGWRAEAVARPEVTSTGFLFWLSDMQREAVESEEKEVDGVGRGGECLEGQEGPSEVCRGRIVLGVWAWLGGYVACLWFCSGCLPILFSGLACRPCRGFAPSSSLLKSGRVSEGHWEWQVE